MTLENEIYTYIKTHNGQVNIWDIEYQFKPMEKEVDELIVKLENEKKIESKQVINPDWSYNYKYFVNE